MRGKALGSDENEQGGDGEPVCKEVAHEGGGQGAAKLGHRGMNVGNVLEQAGARCVVVPAGSVEESLEARSDSGNAYGSRHDVPQMVQLRPNGVPCLQWVRQSIHNLPNSGKRQTATEREKQKSNATQPITK